MRDETRRRLEKAIWARRAKFAGAGLALLTLVAGGLWLEDLEARVVNKRVSGVIEAVGQLHGAKTRTMEIGLSVEVKLDDGRLAKVMALRTAEPHVGDRVEITEQIHGTGRHNFVWN